MTSDSASAKLAAPSHVLVVEMQLQRGEQPGGARREENSECEEAQAGASPATAEHAAEAAENEATYTSPLHAALGRCDQERPSLDLCLQTPRIRAPRSDRTPTFIPNPLPPDSLLVLDGGVQRCLKPRFRRPAITAPVAG